MKLSTLICTAASITMTTGFFNCQAASPTIDLKETATDFTVVAKKAIPAVVSIRVKETSKKQSRGRMLDDEDAYGDFGGGLLQRFFGIPFGETDSTPREGQASGFIVSADGHILTNRHVVNNSDEILVHLSDGREMTATVIGQDSNTDIAMIKIDAKDLQFISLGDSDKIEVGQWVVAIGTPLGLEASLTTGVVSAKGRNNLDLTRVEDYIQTNANLYHGNSGGPLLNLNSEVIGINTAIASRMGGYIGIGFAVPSNIARNVMDQLMNKGSVSRGFIGVLLQDVDKDLASAFGLPRAEGALITQVSKDSPAEKAGLKQGDVITAYNNTPIPSVASLRTAIAMMSPGTELKLKIMRDNKPQDLTVSVGELASNTPVETHEQPHRQLGITVGALTPELREKLGLHNENGVLITQVAPGSIASIAGLHKGSLILAVNRQNVDSVEAFQNIVKASTADQPILLLVKERAGLRYISLKTG